MGTDKRDRQRANRQARREAETSAASRRRRNKLIIRLGIVAVVVIGALLVYSILSDGDGDGEEVSAAASTTADAASSGTTAAGSATTVAGGTTVAPGAATTAPGSATTSAGGTTPTTAVDGTPTTVATSVTLPAPVDPDCPAEDGSSERQVQFTAAPPTCIDPDASYVAEVVTSEGTFSIDLDTGADEAAVNNFVFLSRYHFYDGLDFHRVATDFVIQGGDPQGDGSGGPGYEWTGGRPASPDVYQAGSVSMANSGGDPSTNGSQFFVALDDLSDRLPADYTYFGDVVEGFDVVETIGALGQGDGPPSRPVTIDSVTITQS